MPRPVGVESLLSFRFVSRAEWFSLPRGLRPKPQPSTIAANRPRRMHRSDGRQTGLGFSSGNPAVLLLLVFSALCISEPPSLGSEKVTVEATRIRLGAEEDTIDPTYSLAGDTRPLLVASPEKTVSVVFSGGAKELRFLVPFALREGDRVAVSGVYQPQGSTIVPLRPAIVEPKIGAKGGVAALPVPVIARMPRTKTTFSLKLAPLPHSRIWERVSEPLSVPDGARLEVSLGVSDCGRVPGAVPLQLSVGARNERGEERVLLEKIIDPASADAATWQLAEAGLEALAGQQVRFFFRARAVRPGLVALFPLFGDPKLTRDQERQGKQRNLVLISLDTLGARHLGAYGSRRPTSPAIDALARQGVLFERVFAQWPETAGSHMSLFTARYVSDHGVRNFVSEPAPDVRTLAQDLRRAAYLTKAFTEDGGVWAQAGFARGFHSYVEAKSADFVYRGEAARTFAAAGEWVKENAGRLFFLFVHTYQVHAPYRPPVGFRQAFGMPDGPGPIALDELNYDREVAFTDRQVEAFVAALEQAGLSSHTIVVLTSDHGEEFGEHGGRGHGRTLYSEVTHVPLIMWAPGFLPPKKVKEPAALIDLRPTLLELLGLPGPKERVPGRSLASKILGRGETLQARAVVSELDRDGLRVLAVRNDRATLIKDLVKGTSRCYEGRDTWETRPIPTLCDELEKLAAGHSAALAEAPARARAKELDPQTRAKLKVLGYVE